MPDNSLDIQHLFSLQGKVALVTGGSRGIGYMISQGLLQAGARVYISARKAQEMAAIAVYLCSRAGAYTHGAIIPVDSGTSINHQHAAPAGA
ncbi:MAG: SDR family NAD(P)-dependent oxidoreductase [Halioglobus sp.]